MTTIDEIKAAIDITDIISEDQPLRGNGKFLRGQEHDSLVVNTHDQAYFWNVKGQSGDVIDWLENERGLDFKSAVELLAARAGMEPPHWKAEDTATRMAARARDDALTVAARHFVRALRGETGKVARDYCYSRGWTDETIKSAGLGYADGDRNGLRGSLGMYEIDTGCNAAAAALKIPGGMLVYPHVERGRVGYLSCRGIGEKTHYNPPADLIGDRRLYHNFLYGAMDDLVIVCEGQADAISWGQWGFPAIAIAGVAVNQLLLKTLARHKHIVLALDNNAAGERATRDIADALGPLVRIVQWPDGIEDANEWLQQGAGQEDAQGLVDGATSWVEVLASEAGISANGNKAAKLERMTRQAARLGAFELATMRDRLSGLAVLGLREFDRLLKTTKGDIEAESDDEDHVMIEQPIVGGMVHIPDSDDWYLVETLYEPPEGASGVEARGGGRTLLAIRHPDGHISTSTHLDVDGVRYHPPMPEVALLTKRVVAFAPYVGPLLTTEELIDEIQALIHKYLDVSNFFERMSAYYVLLSWFYDAFNIVPYLRYRGDYGTGKSRARKVVGGICFRPMRASGASSDAALFRMIDVWRGTLLMEEADYERSDYAQLVVKMLNQGYDREQGIILRCADRSQDFETEAYVCYGPKILAMRGEFSDKALESRCLTEEMRGRTRDDVPRELPREFWTSELPRLQALLVRYRLAHWRPDMSKVADEKILNLPIEDRLIQITLSLFAIVDDERLRERLRSYLIEYHQKIIGQRGMTLSAKVLEALVLLDHTQGDDGLDRPQRDLSVNTIADKVNQLIDFENWGADDYIKGRTLKGKDGVGSRKVGYVLRDDLQLETERRSKFNGRYCVAWDEPRVKSLRKRYGLDDDRLVDLLEINNRIQAMESEARENADQPVHFASRDELV